MQTAQADPVRALVKMKALEQDMSLKELADKIGAPSTRLSGLMHGFVVGEKYRPKIEKVLGVVPLTDIAS